MPTYEYTCKQCGKRFELTLSFGDHAKKHKCPECRSTKLEQRISSFVAVTSKKA
ncbi:MAG: zinc ribbon domain-containing protein [Phycisphaerales bacterium]|nr:MAG: zinc ribbon domain-containing protein [Phycisphaerales bacterium]